MENKKEFTTREVLILVLVIVTGIAFMESDSWRTFFLNIMVYGLIGEFSVILWGIISSPWKKPDFYRNKDKIVRLNINQIQILKLLTKQRKWS